MPFPCLFLNLWPEILGPIGKKKNTLYRTEKLNGIKVLKVTFTSCADGC